MSSTPTYALLIGEDTPFLLRCFHYLSGLHQPLDITIYASHNRLEQANIHINLLQLLYTQNYFTQHQALTLKWKLAQEAVHIDKETLFIPTPDEVIDEGEDTILVFNDRQLNIIEARTENNMPLNEALLQEIIQTTSDFEWQQRSVWERTIYEQLSRLQQASEPSNADIALFTLLQYCEIWKHDLHFQWRKEIQEPALRQLMQNPEHAGAHLVLSIFKRYAKHCPQEIASFINTWKQHHTGYLRIMPPLKNNALTYIVTTYNRPESFKRAMTHILNQSVEQWFVSILDHGSGPETQQHIENFKRQCPDRIQVYRHDENAGPKAVFTHLQRLIQEAPTELICFCSDDDFVWQNHAEKTLNLFKQYPWISMAYGGKQLISPQNQPLHSIGPYYASSQIVNPYTELQRIIPMRSASPHCVIRKAVLADLGTTDPYVPSEAHYGLHDTLSHIFAIALYEVACVNEILSSVTLDNQSAFMQEDISSVWLLMAREVIQKYHALFDEDFPIQPVQQLLKMLFESSSVRLWQEWENMASAENYQQALDTKYQFYKEAFTFKQEVLPLCSPTTPFLFESRHPYAPL